MGNYWDGRFQGPSLKGEGNSQVHVEGGGGVGWWFNSNAYVQGWGGTFQVPCKRLVESS